METAARSVKPRLTWRSVELLFELLEQPEPVLSGAALADTVGADARPLLAAGFLVPDGHEAAASSGDHDARPLDLAWSAETKTFGYFDPAEGWVSVDGPQLTRYRASIAAITPALLARVNSAGKQAKPWPSEFVWDFGELRVPHRTQRVPALLVRRAGDPPSWQTIRRALLKSATGQNTSAFGNVLFGINAK